MTSPVAPAVYAPAAVKVPPEALSTNAQLYPAPLPPEAVKFTLPRGGSVEIDGEATNIGGKMTCAWASAEPPSESVTLTTWVVGARAQAVYQPVTASMDPPRSWSTASRCSCRRPAGQRTDESNGRAAPLPAGDR